MAKRRKHIPKDIEARVLLTSRRRCCLCFVYEKRDEECRGQIAHIDRNRSNNAFENLAFLCLYHHDAFDSTSSQSKGWQPEEVRNARQLLYDDFMNSRKLTINIFRDLDSFTDVQREGLRVVIATAAGRDVEVNIMKGSTKVEVQLDQQEIIDVLRALREGALDEYGDYSVSIERVSPERPPPVIGESYERQLVTAAVPRDVTLDALVSPGRWEEWNRREFFAKWLPNNRCTVLVIAGADAASLRYHQVMLSLYLFDDEVGPHSNNGPIALLEKFAMRYGVMSVFRGHATTMPNVIHRNIETPIGYPVPPQVAWDAFRKAIEPVMITPSVKQALFFFDSTKTPVVIDWMCVIDLWRYGDALERHGVTFPRKLLHPPA